MGRIIGIDLGTTYSAVGVVGATGKPEILPNREGERITPSVVMFQGDQTLVGSMAKRSAPTAPNDVVQFVKRHMGDPDWCFVTSDEAQYGAEQISAIILRRLKEDAEAALGEPVTDAVISVPAFFNDARRKATIDAGKIAGLNVRRIVNEPTAAALAYGVDGGADGTVLVYDLGGGTFDVTVMRISGGEFDVLSTGGNRNLGGYNWDNALMLRINELIQQQGGPDLLEDNLQMAELRDKAELAKRSLTTMETAKVFVTAGGKPHSVQISREQFEELTSGLLSETRDLAESVLGESGLDWAKLDRVLLVGGSTHMPMVQKAIVELSGKQPVRGVNPDEAVALGAAILAAATSAAAAPGLGSGQAPLAGLPGGLPVISDVTAHGLGTLALNGGTDVMENFVLVRHNTKVPAKGSGNFATIEENQRRIEVVITEGDETDPDRVTRVGKSTFDMPRYPKGAPIRIDIAYDFDGVIFAEAYDGTTGRKLGDMQIERESNLTPEQVADAISAMAKLEVN
jgi:molecular chaperone DnaK